MKRFPFQMATVVCVAVLSACSAHRHAVTKPVHCAGDGTFKQQWESVKVVRNHPIVDVHTHAFNARYLPIKRVMRGRTWSTSFWWVPEFMLDVAAVVVTGTTPKNEAEARERAARIAEWERVNGSDGSESTRLRAMLQTNRKVPRMVWRKDLRGSGDDIQPMGWLAYRLGFREMVVGLVGGMFAHEPGHAGDKESVARFAVTLMSSEREVRERLEKAFPAVDLFVYQSMDLVPSFYAGSNTGTYSYSRDFHRVDGEPSAALPRIRQMCRESDGRMIHFVAWNPFRTLNGEGEKKLVSSLSIVKQAVRNGAAGVKFYPPLGYRASGNDFSRIKRPWGGEALEQWKARYTTGTAERLDAINEELFAWCEANDVPVFTHCNTGEFRAYDSEVYADMANPQYWEPVLAKHPRLRLCFGHAGGVTDWYGGCAEATGSVKDGAKWGEKVRALCLKYPNVYCEFGIHEDVADAGKAEHFYASLKKHLPERGPGGWTLGDKVMYGSDWFMPVGVTPEKYLESFERLFSLPGLTQYKARFFAGNAMRYLKRSVRNRW